MDEEIRTLERLVAADPAVAPELFAEKLRSGEISHDGALLAAWLGDETARQALCQGVDAPPEPWASRTVVGCSVDSVGIQIDLWALTIVEHWGFEAALRVGIAATKAVLATIGQRCCPRCGCPRVADGSMCDPQDCRTRATVQDVRPEKLLAWLHNYLDQKTKDRHVGQEFNVGSRRRWISSLATFVADPRLGSPFFVDAVVDAAEVVGFESGPVFGIAAVTNAAREEVVPWALTRTEWRNDEKKYGSTKPVMHDGPGGRAPRWRR